MTTTRRGARTTPRKGEGSWLVLCRDISDVVHIDDQPQTSVALVLDMDTGLARGVSVGETTSEAIQNALATAISTPPSGLEPGHPNTVLCPTPHLMAVTAGLSTLLLPTRRPSVRPIEPPSEALDIFDELIGHLSGRTLSPGEPPSPASWSLLYGAALDFFRAAPWERWSDSVVFRLEVVIEADAKTWAVIVLGNAGVQAGLVIYPGDDLPAEVREWRPGRRPVAPFGTLMLTLDPVDAVPPDLRDKAYRYGWPRDVVLVPAVMSVGPDSVSDPEQADVDLVTTAIAAIRAHDARGPVVVEHAHAATTGSTDVGDGRRAHFAIVQVPAAAAPPEPRFRVHRSGTDLVPDHASVSLGHFPWSSVAHFEGQARILRPFPSDAPARAGQEVPMVAILTSAREGEEVAAKISELDPYGVGFVSFDGRELVVLAGGNGSEILIDLDEGARGPAEFLRRLKATRGLQVILVADEAALRGSGSVYGMFECHQPPLPPPRRASSARNKGGARRRP